MSPRIWTLIALLTLISPIAHAASGELSLPLQVAAKSSLQRYTTPGTNACLILNAGRELGEQDIAGLQKLIGDLDITAGPGLSPESQPAGALLYTYKLVPELKGTKLVIRGLLSSNLGNAVKVESRGPASLGETVERDLGFSDARLVFSHLCD
jgi:hypothetical protein